MTVAELIDLLMKFPEEEPVYVPDFNSNNNHPVNNLVLTERGVLIDY
jgi:hypothetical protein